MKLHPPQPDLQFPFPPKCQQLMILHSTPPCTRHFHQLSPHLCSLPICPLAFPPSSQLENQAIYPVQVQVIHQVLPFQRLPQPRLGLHIHQQNPTQRIPLQPPQVGPQQLQNLPLPPPVHQPFYQESFSI